MLANDDAANVAYMVKGVAINPFMPQPFYALSLNYDAKTGTYAEEGNNGAPDELDKLLELLYETKQGKWSNEAMLWNATNPPEQGEMSIRQAIEANISDGIAIRKRLAAVLSDPAINLTVADDWVIDKMNQQVIDAADRVKQYVQNGDISSGQRVFDGAKKLLNEGATVDIGSILKRPLSFQGTEITVQVGGYEGFKCILASHESGGNTDPYSLENQYGYIGKYQMGESALEEAGLYVKDKTRKNDYIGTWTEKAKDFGVNSKESFLSTPAIQEVAIKAYHKKVWSYVSDFSKYIGTEIHGVTVTASGLLAAGHLLGRGGLIQLFGGEKYFNENADGIPVDGNGTRITKYMKDMGGYDLIELLGYNPDEGKVISNSYPVQESTENQPSSKQPIYDQYSSDELYNISKPLKPKVTNSEGNRSTDGYNKGLDQFQVIMNPRYTPRDITNDNVDETFCNVYVEDVLNAMGVPLPEYMVSNGIKNWMSSQAGKDAGWIEVTADEVQQFANSGYPTIGVNSGHVAMIAPSPNPEDGLIYVSQAGGAEWITRLSPINSVWSKSEPKQFFYHK